MERNRCCSSLHVAKCYSCEFRLCSSTFTIDYHVKNNTNGMGIKKDNSPGSTNMLRYRLIYLARTTVLVFNCLPKLRKV